MLGRLAALALLSCLPWLGNVHAQGGRPPAPAPSQPVPPSAPAAEPATPIVAWGLALILPVVVLVVVCMPSRKG